jgi:cytidine deaminase
MAKEEKVTISYTTYGSWDELEEKNVRLLRDAAQAAARAYAPYSEFRVGAAVRMESGRIVLGNNQENASYPAGCCAERVALHAAMATYPDDVVDRIAVVSPTMPGKEPVTPCGVCRQVMLEQENRQGSPIRILLADPGGKVLELQRTSDLLPLSFKGDFLTR